MLYFVAAVVLMSNPYIVRLNRGFVAEADPAGLSDDAVLVDGRVGSSWQGTDVALQSFSIYATRPRRVVNFVGVMGSNQGVGSARTITLSGPVITPDPQLQNKNAWVPVGDPLLQWINGGGVIVTEGGLELRTSVVPDLGVDYTLEVDITFESGTPILYIGGPDMQIVGSPGPPEIELTSGTTTVGVYSLTDTAEIFLRVVTDGSPVQINRMAVYETNGATIEWPVAGTSDHAWGDQPWQEMPHDGRDDSRRIDWVTFDGIAAYRIDIEFNDLIEPLILKEIFLGTSRQLECPIQSQEYNHAPLVGPDRTAYGSVFQYRRGMVLTVALSMEFLKKHESFWLNREILQQGGPMIVIMAPDAETYDEQQILFGVPTSSSSKILPNRVSTTLSLLLDADLSEANQ